MLLVNVKELWNWNTHLVGSPNQVSFVAGFLILNSFSLLVVADSFIDGVGDLCEGLLTFVKDKSFLLNFDLVCLVD